MKSAGVGKEGSRRKKIRAWIGDRRRDDWPGFFGVTQVYIRAGVYRRAIQLASVPLGLTSRLVGGEIEAVLLISSIGRAREKTVVRACCP